MNTFIECVECKRKIQTGETFTRYCVEPSDPNGISFCESCNKKLSHGEILDIFVGRRTT